MVAAHRNRKLSGDVEGDGHVLEIVEGFEIDLIAGAKIDTGPDSVLARLQTIAEVGDKIPGGRDVEPTPPCEVALAILQNAVELTDADTIDKAQGRKEVRADLLEPRIEAPGFVRVIDRHAEGVVVSLGVRKAALVEKIGLQDLAGQKVRVAELEIGARERVLASARRIAVGVDDTHLRFTDGPGHACDREHLAVLRVAGAVGHDGERTDAEAGVVAGQFRPGNEAHGQTIRQTHVAREERRSVLGRIQILGAPSADGETAAAELERRRVLEEEIAGLRLEETEPRGVDLKEVQRTVGKIRIDGQRAGELRCDLVEGVAAPAEAERFVLRLLPVEAIAQSPVDLHVEPQPLIDALKSGQRAGARDVGGPFGGGNRAPAGALVLAANLAGEIEHPLGLRRIEGKIAERNGHLRRPAVIHDARAAAPDRVPFPDEIRVVLDQVIDAPAKRVHDEEISVAPCVQRIEGDAHGVVDGKTAVAVLRGGRDELRVAIVGVDGDVEIVRVVEDPQLGALGDRLTGIGLELIEFVDELSLRPHGVRHVAVDGRSFRWFDSSGHGGRDVRAEVPRRRRCPGGRRAFGRQSAPGEEKQRRRGDARPERGGVRNASPRGAVSWPALHLPP